MNTWNRLSRGRRKGIGAVMFMLHRITGILLTFYLFAHLATLATVLQGAEGFSKAMKIMNSPTTKMLELLLVTTVAFHGLNGIRLAILSFISSRTSISKLLAYAVLGATLTLLVISFPLFVK